MRRRWLLSCMAAMLPLLVATRDAAAQTTPNPPIGSLVSIGDQVWITTADGVIHQGRVLSLTTAALELQLAQRKETVPFDRLRRVERIYHDRLTDGLKWGLTAGLLGGIVIGTVSTSSDCHKRAPDDTCSAADVFSAMAIAGGVGALGGGVIGTVADAMHSSVFEVWRAPGSRVSAKPSANVGAGRLDVRLTIRW